MSQTVAGAASRARQPGGRSVDWRLLLLRGFIVATIASFMACVAAAIAFAAAPDGGAGGQAPALSLDLAQLEPGAPTSFGTPGTAVQQVPPTVVGAAGGRDWKVSLGLGIAGRPEYPGSGKIRVSPFPAIDVTYLDRVFASTTEGLGVYAWRSPSLQVGASVNVSDDTRYHGKNAILRGLPKIKPGGVASVFVRYQIGAFTLNADVRERFGYANGVSADVGANYRFRVGPNWSFAVGPSLTIASAKLNNAFFGVTASDAARAAEFGNVILPYRPGGGIRNISFNISSNYEWNDHWGVASRLDLATIVGRDGHSPITKQRFQPSLGSFVYYRF